MNTATDKIAFSDLEWSGQVNRATGQGRAFALLLAMLESDVLERPKVIPIEDENPVTDNALTSVYRRASLSAAAQDWTNAVENSQHFARNPADGLLFQTMHPQPLSLFNDPKRIDDEVLANCDYYTQTRLATPAEKQVTEDNTQMFDVVEQLDKIAAAFA